MFRDDKTNLSRLRSIGGSLVVTVPKEIVREKSLIEGELIEIKIEKRKMEGFGSMKGMKSFSRDDRMGDRDI